MPSPPVWVSFFARAHDARPENGIDRILSGAQRKDRRAVPRAGGTPGTLVSGHKKDVVISPRLTTNPEKLAIYGWHQLNGVPSSRSVPSMAPVMPTTVMGFGW